MSLGGKTANKGSTKSAGHQTQSKHNHVHKNSDKSQRAARAAADAGGGDDTNEMQRAVGVLMEMTCRSEEEVCSALHDCDNDMAKACEMLLEQVDQTQGQWQTNEKKKKKTSNATNANSGGPGTERDGDDWPAGSDKNGTVAQSGAIGSGPHTAPREHRPPRGRSSNRPYRGRGGEVHVGEEGEVINRSGGSRRGPMGRGGGRGGGRGSNRGGRGSRPPRVPRNSQPSEPCWDNSGNSGHQDAPMDGWGDTFPSPEDWDNEEWSGSLADTKVFTPSSIGNPDVTPVVSGTDHSSSSQINSVSDQSAVHNSTMNSLQDPSDYSKQNNSSVLGSETSSSPSLPPSLPQDPAIYAYTNSSHLPKAQSPVAMNVSGTLSAAQSQYLSQLTQKSEVMKQERVMLNSQVYNPNYGVYGATDVSNQRKPVQRARVPPPSKIPSSAVEMPGELGSSSISTLDVQFGALDLGSETMPFLTDNVSNISNSVANDKYNSVPNALDHNLSDSSSGNVSVQQNVSLDSHQSSGTSTLTNDVSAYTTNASRANQMLTDSLSATVSEQNSTGSGAQYGAGVSRATSSVSASHVPQLTTVAGLESQLTGKSSGVSDLSSQQSTYSTYPGQVTPYGVSQPTKQSYHPTHPGYPGNPYSQVNSSGTSFTAASSIASGNAYPTNPLLNQYHVSHTQPLNTYQNSSSVSVYGNSLYTASSVPYNSYQNLQNSSNKISSNVKDSQYDNAVTSGTNSLTNTASQASQSSSKMSTSSGKPNVSSASVMSSGSAGASHVGAAVMGQYIMGQPYYPQQPVPAYTYEELQLMQQRIPHLTPGYYEVNYGTGGGGPGAAARDTPLASFASLGAGGEARFGRAEAPSPQAVAGGGAGAAQPPQAGMPSYAYYYSSGMLPAGSFQAYGTQPLYPIATAGSTGSSNYGGGKSGVVGGAGAYVGGGGGVTGAYGAPAPAAAPPQTYETVQQPQTQQLNSHQPDYKTGGGYSTSQQTGGVKQGVSNSNAAGNDLSNSMYGGKGHVSLTKVNSYDKPYHSATPPPPFGLGTAAGVGAGGYAGPQIYIPHAAMAPPQQHQMDGRVNNSHRRDNGTNNNRGGASNQSKQGGGTKQGYSPSYWTPN